VYAALSRALEELQRREVEAEGSERALREQEEGMSVMAAQQAALYAQYVRERKGWEAAVAGAKEAADEAETELEACKARLSVVERSVGLLAEDGSRADLGSDAKDGSGTTATQRLRAELRRLTGELAAWEEEGPRMRRKLRLAADESDAARRAQAAAEDAAIESEASLRRRVVYLESWREGARARLERLSAQLEGAVRGPVHAAALRRESGLRSRVAASGAEVARLTAELAELRGQRRRRREAEEQARLLAVEAESLRG